MVRPEGIKSLMDHTDADEIPKRLHSRTGKCGMSGLARATQVGTKIV
jgi:hypothetical protein